MLLAVRNGYSKRFKKLPRQTFPHHVARTGPPQAIKRDFAQNLPVVEPGLQVSSSRTSNGSIHSLVSFWALHFAFFSE